jgi:shikimate kinase
VSGPALVVVGPPTAGKTTVGTAVAAALGLPFRDTDADVEAQTGATIGEIFVESGEPHFRALEEAAVARALAEHDGVLALGGGAVLSPATRALLTAYAADGGRVLHLDVDLASAVERAGLSNVRPLLGVGPRTALRGLLDARAPLYAEVATLVVATGGRSPEDVVAEVLSRLEAAR